MVETETYTTGNEILIAPDKAMRFGCRVKKPTSADTDGKYRVKAGTPLYTTEALTGILDRNKPLSDTKGTGTAVGVLYQDIVVKEGEEEANGVLVTRGTVDYLKLDADVKTKVDTAKASLTLITFENGRAD